MQLGCVLTSFVFCAFGSPYLRATDVLHNKPWLCTCAANCSCQRQQHWPGEGFFDEASLVAFKGACRPTLEGVYDRAPAYGASFASFGALLPTGLRTRIGAGSFAASRGHVPEMLLKLRYRTAARFELDLGLGLV